MANNIVARLAQLAEIGKYAGGINRALATPPERRARELFAQWAAQAGYTLTQDRVGNLFARRNGSHTNSKPILVGSHLDTVPTGGAYDGAYGVAGALCALQVLDERGISLAHPVEAVAWAGEEGSRFPLGCLGSSVFSGLCDADRALALHDHAGISLRDALAGTEGGLLAEVPLREVRDVAAYLELHVEQGPVLEREGVPLGVVTAIAAQRRYRVRVDGTSGHAGTVPMTGRSDALCAAAELVLAMESTARNAASAVATVGRMIVEPGGTNVIPARAIFSLDVRSPDDAQVEAIEAGLHETVTRIERERTVRIATEILEARKATPMDESLRVALHRAIASMNARAVDVPSGAGHDAMCLAQIAPAAMIFVPSTGGRSHVAEERTDDADLERGVEALAAAIVEVDRMLS
jgi:hydantoinase/carbamoylase family amidase